jgi:hypothetical protein
MQKQKCKGCGIVIEPGYIEEMAYQIGGYQICSWCLRHLKKWGRLEIGELPKRGLKRYLHLDGSVTRVKVMGELGNEMCDLS